MSEDRFRHLTAILELENRFHMQPETLRQIGALVVLCSMFEWQTEKTLWAISGLGPKPGEIPSTERKPISNLLKQLRGLGKSEAGSLAESIVLMCDVAEGLLQFRNAIAHGLLVNYNYEHPSFVKDGAWHFERRKEDAYIAHATAANLDGAIAAAETLYNVSVQLFYGCSGPSARQNDTMSNWIEPLATAKEAVRTLPFANNNGED